MHTCLISILYGNDSVLTGQSCKVYLLMLYWIFTLDEKMHKLKLTISLWQLFHRDVWNMHLWKKIKRQICKASKCNGNLPNPPIYTGRYQDTVDNHAILCLAWQRHRGSHLVCQLPFWSCSRGWCFRSYLGLKWLLLFFHVSLESLPCPFCWKWNHKIGSDKINLSAIFVLYT